MSNEKKKNCQAPRARCETFVLGTFNIPISFINESAGYSFVPSTLDGFQRSSIMCLPMVLWFSRFSEGELLGYVPSYWPSLERIDIGQRVN